MVEFEIKDKKLKTSNIRDIDLYTTELDYYAGQVLVFEDKVYVGLLEPIVDSATLNYVARTTRTNDYIDISDRMVQKIYSDTLSYLADDNFLNFSFLSTENSNGDFFDVLKNIIITKDVHYGDSFFLKYSNFRNLFYRTIKYDEMFLENEEEEYIYKKSN